MRVTALFALVVTLLCAGPAHSDPQYTAQDIVKHFAPVVDPDATRGICVGTEIQCGGTAPETATSKGLDLLITFDLNSDELTKQARENLDQFADALGHSQLAAARFAVEGHTDARGSESFNLGLSERRAAAVVRYLRQKGVDPTRLEARGLGKSQPRVDDGYDPINRRVETRLIP